MATTTLERPNIHFLARDIASSNNSLYISDHNRINSGDIVYDVNAPENRFANLSKLTDQELNERPLSDNYSHSVTANKKVKNRKEFTVTRKNSYKGPSYFRLSQSQTPQKIPKSLRSFQPHRRKNSKFISNAQIDPILDQFPSTSLLDNPSFMVQYFTKTLELIKKEPSIDYQILKAHLDLNNEDNQSFQKMDKKKKYHSLPIMSFSDKMSEENKMTEKQNQRKSAPVIMKYIPTDMKMTDYLNTPLDIYKHRKYPSGIPETTKSKIASDSKDRESRETKLSNKARNSWGTQQTQGSESGADSVATAALYAHKSKLTPVTDKNSNQRSIPLQTTKNECILPKISSPPTTIHESSTSKESETPLRRELSDQQREEYFAKYGTPLHDNPDVQAVIQQGDPSKNRASQCGDLSIATGNELYGTLKADIFGERFGN